tara:strand:- start:714 stop:1226 length:513 start_codon:yes stop_codon:yes gene_type:complete
MSTYRPLPEGLTIKESKVEGLGLFSSIFISEGSRLGITHISNVIGEGGWIRTPLGGFINHSLSYPNAIIENHQHGIRVLRTTQDIHPGEEIVITYTLYNVGEEEESSTLRHHHITGAGFEGSGHVYTMNGITISVYEDDDRLDTFYASPTGFFGHKGQRLRTVKDLHDLL